MTMTTDETEMHLLEDGDLKYFWECSACHSMFKDTSKFEKSTRCPECERRITKWVGFYDEEWE